ncbi:Thioredoxin-2, mitochondrial [Schizosaccharomyces pombe]
MRGFIANSLKPHMRSFALRRSFTSSRILRKVNAVESFGDYTTRISADKVTVVDFYADWCGPCKYLKPFLEKLSEQNQKASFIAVNADKFSDIAQKNGVYALPTMVLFRKGQELDRIVGADVKTLSSLLAKYQE